MPTPSLSHVFPLWPCYLEAFLLLHLSSPIYFSRTSSGFIDFMISTKNDCLQSEFLSRLSGPLECNLPSRFLDLAECADNLPTPLPPTSAAPVWFNGLLQWPQLDFITQNCSGLGILNSSVPRVTTDASHTLASEASAL